MITTLDTPPKPSGELALQTMPMPGETNAAGDISGGWLVSQMDTAAGIAATRIARGRVVTVAIDRMSFMIPIKVGSVVGLYTQVLNIGRSSMQVQVEAWMEIPGEPEMQKVTEGVFVFVALDREGKTRSINPA